MEFMPTETVINTFISNENFCWSVPGQCCGGNSDVGVLLLVHSIIQVMCLCKLFRNCLDVYSLG